MAADQALELAGLWADGGPVIIKTSADSAGAVWNLALVEDDRSEGVHNPAYIKELLGILDPVHGRHFEADSAASCEGNRAVRGDR